MRHEHGLSVTDAAGPLAVVYRDNRASGDVPEWVEQLLPARRWWVPFMVALIGEPRAAPSAAIVAGRDGKGVFVAPGTPVGKIRDRPFRQGFRFSSCICGRTDRACSCAPLLTGKVGYVGRGVRQTSSVVDDFGRALAHIAWCKLDIERGWFSEPGPGNPRVYAVTELRPGLNWYDDGLLVALAALCLERGLTPSG